MDTIIMNSWNTKTSDTRRLLLNLSDKINLKGSDKYVALSNLSIYCTWKSTKKSYKNRKLKTSAWPWNEEFQLPDGSYSVSDTQDYFDYIIKKHEVVPDNSSITMYINKVGKINTFKIKTGYYLEILTPTTMKVLGNLEALKVR